MIPESEQTQADGRNTVCAATICPYLGAADGSPWTGRSCGDCHDECGWYDGDYGGCLPALDLVAEIARQTDGPLPTEDDDAVPPCEHSEICQWQQQGEGLCPPRLAVVTGHDDALTILPDGP